jgi:hypothetical protein
MKAIVRAGWAMLACVSLSGLAAAQPVNLRCSPANSTPTAQSFRCQGGVTIVAENGARYVLQDRDGNGRVDSAELSSKALLIEVPKRSSPMKFRVTTPQAVAAVRGTKWAVDAVEAKTSVFVVNGSVAVTRRSGGSNVTLSAGEGVDVEGTGALTVKRWPAARVAALMARLGR